MATTWTPQQARAPSRVFPGSYKALGEWNLEDSPVSSPPVSQLPAMSYPPYNNQAGYYSGPNNFAVQPRVPAGQLSANNNPFAVGARVWARVTLQGHVSWGQALILRGLAYMSTVMGMGYQIEFSSVPECGGPSVQNARMDVRQDQLYSTPPRMY